MTDYKLIQIQLNIPKNADNQWVYGLNTILIPSLSDFNLSVFMLAEKLKISEKQLGRLIKKNTGYTSAQYIKELRFQKAKLLIEHQSYETIAEISYAVGFLRPIYFSNEFRKRFKQLPSQMMKKIKNK